MSLYLARAYCPCCGASALNARAATSAPTPAETLPIGRHGMFLSGYSAERTFFTYSRCSQCSGLFCKEYYTQDQLDKLYGHQAENMLEVPLKARRRTQERYAAQALAHVVEGGSFLEIGSDIGLFAATCARSGRFSSFLLYEPNRDVHSVLDSEMKGTNYSVSERVFGPTDMPPQSVSLATLVHVLDHLIDPFELLAGLHAVMKPGGVLYIVTHNAGSRLAQILGRRWPPYTLQHPQLFNSASIRTLLERSGFRVAERVSTVNDFPIGHLARAALKVAGLPDVTNGWSGPLLPARLGNMATIAKRI